LRFDPTTIIVLLDIRRRMQMTGTGTRKRILVVDDEPQNITIMREILKSDYTVIAATDGARALSLAQSASPPDLIMLDILMPGLDGYEILRRLKANARTAGLPVVLVTAKGEVDDKMTGYELGSSDYITKPFESSFVLSVVRRLLSRS
jgi:DNA-binding response OmpR family regulator